MQPPAFLDALKVWHVLEVFWAGFQAFAATTASVAIAAFWQGALVVAGLALCVRLAPRVSAAQRFAIWSAGFAALVCLPFLPLLERVAASASGGSESASADTFSPWLQVDLRWTLILAALWLIASVARVGDLAVHSLHLWKLWRTAVLLETTSDLSSERGYEICTTMELDRPSVIGFFRPRILIPNWLLPRLTPQELRQIVLHEAEHLCRRDDWTNLLQKLCLVLFPLNPALWWIERKLCREREMACDEGVVRVTRAPRAYAACLTNLAERRVNRRAEALSLGAWQKRPDLARRVHSILQLHRSRGLSPFAWRALLGAFGCVLLASTIELARCPQLVAFVSERKARPAQEVTGIANRDAARLLRTRYAVVPAKAVLPVHQRGGAGQTRSAKTRAGTALRPIEAKATAQEQYFGARNQSSGDPMAIQQLVVFSAWEQMQTPASAWGALADYDTATNALIDGANRVSDANHPATASQVAPTNQSAAAQQPSKNPATRITIMQLIFQVNPDSPTTAPIPDGWLVLKL